jgi:Divergent CRAL/TRIO domain
MVVKLQLTRAMRKRLQKLYIVHERAWVRFLVEMFSTIVSPKFRKKIIHGQLNGHGRVSVLDGFPS